MRQKKSHGGARTGAGRPKGQGPYGEPTQALRVPMSLVSDIRSLLDARRKKAQEMPLQNITAQNSDLQIFRPQISHSATKLPLYRSQVAAGFPSPADDYLEDSLDLNELLIDHPAATFLVRVSGESMLGAGIHPGDVMVVDRSLDVSDGKIVIAVLNGELTVKRFRKQKQRVFLQAENPKFPNIEINENQDFRVWGVVVSVIHKV